MWRTIVGVVGNVRRKALSLEETPSFYAPATQDPPRQVHVLARGDDPALLLARLDEAVHRLDASLPLFGATSLEALVAEGVARERYVLALLGVSALLALGIACIGIFAVVSYAAEARLREIGVRIAIGARASSIVALVLRGGLGPVVLGGALGLVGATLMAGSMAELLYGVGPLDPLTLAAVFSVHVAAAALACASPARHATRVDPNTVLRTE